MAWTNTWGVGICNFESEKGIQFYNLEVDFAHEWISLAFKREAAKTSSSTSRSTTKASSPPSLSLVVIGPLF